MNSHDIDDHGLAPQDPADPASRQAREGARCPECEGAGTMASGDICPVCEGTGQAAGRIGGG